MSQPANAIEALSFLLSEWVETISFSQRDVVALNHLWIALADGLCDGQSVRKAPFLKELGSMRTTSEAGKPPTQALEKRLYELISGGIRDLFLVIAVRQAVEQLIARDFPAHLESWKIRADSVLPLPLQFATQSLGSRVIIEPY